MATNPQLSLPHTPPEDYVEPEVFKIGRNSYEMALYVRDKLHILDPAEQVEKVTQLTLAQIATLHLIAALDTTALPLDFQGRFGNPRPIMYAPPQPPEGHFATGVAYVQKYGLPVKDALVQLEKLGWDDKRIRAIGYFIVDQFVEFQSSLCEVELCDTSYKLTENYMLKLNQKFPLENHDFSEMETNRDKAAHSIAIREWEQMPEREESAQLPPFLHEYSCDRLSQELPRALKRWGKRLDGHPIAPTPRRFPYDPDATRLWRISPYNKRPGPVEVDPTIDPELGMKVWNLILPVYSEYKRSQA